MSHGIATLEASLGTRLFNRLHRRIELTEAGERLYRSVSSALRSIQETAVEIGAGGRPRPLKLAVSIAIATYWLLPRFAELKEICSDIDMHLYTTDWGLDLAGGAIDLAITAGRGDWPGQRLWQFAPTTVHLVCSPAYRDSHPRIRRMADLRHHALIEQDDGVNASATWQTWFSHFGVAAPGRSPDLVVSNYALVVKAAVEGQGLAMGWSHIVAPLLERGDLVRPLDAEMRPDTEIFVTELADAPVDPRRTAVREWLLASATDLARIA